MYPSPAEALRHLYSAFGAVPRPKTIDYCRCCFNAEQERALLAPVALCDLAVDDLQPYAADLMLTVGGIDDLRYFLPRILEIAFSTGFGWPDLEALMGRLARAEWLDWAVAERQAVRGLLDQAWSLALADVRVDIDVLLCAIGQAEPDLEPYLCRWTDAMGQPAAAHQLRNLLQRGSRSLDGHWRPTNAFWSTSDHRVGDWLTTGALRRAVADAFTATENEAALQALADIDALLPEQDK